MDRFKSRRKKSLRESLCLKRRTPIQLDAMVTKNFAIARCVVLFIASHSKIFNFFLFQPLNNTKVQYPDRDLVLSWCVQTFKRCGGGVRI